ncbi:MAG: rhamnulokinase [Planctomycetaceae bacterium]|jgi:rhamnulokinase|nr:rhamnulokinase [Planctomycetaceae bacterium]
MKSKIYIAVDLGASSGRVIAGKFDGQKIELVELSRFDNNAVEIDGGLHWQLKRLWEGILEGARKIKPTLNTAATSIGVDSWAVDFVLMKDGNYFAGESAKAAVCYRDPRTDGMIEEALKILSREEIFQHSGLQFMQINTLYQLLAIQRKDPELLYEARTFLMIPDYFNKLLCSEVCNEYTNATTTQLFDPNLGEWSKFLLGEFKLPRRIFQNVVQPFTDLGVVRLRSEFDYYDGLDGTRVVVPGTHDTASSVFSVPATGKLGECDWCYICLGTWALVGVESLSPIMNQAAYDLNFTNEGGVGGTTRVLKNVSGLWMLQECKRIWKEHNLDYTWDRMEQIAGEVTPMRSAIDIDNRIFLCPTDMPDMIENFCRWSGQTIPEKVEEIIRWLIDSIAVRLWQVVEMCGQITEKNIKTIHVVGGGSRNKLLCQSIADATARPVVAGPVESTAIGNIMCQAIAAGDVADVNQAREIIRNSFEVITYSPDDSKRKSWDQYSLSLKKLQDDAEYFEKREQERQAKKNIP